MSDVTTKSLPVHIEILDLWWKICGEIARIEPVLQRAYLFPNIISNCLKSAFSGTLLPLEERTSHSISPSHSLFPIPNPDFQTSKIRQCLQSE